MKNLKPAEIWFITGSQHLYGEAALKQVAANAQKIVAGLRMIPATMPEDYSSKTRPHHARRNPPALF